MTTKTHESGPGESGPGQTETKSGEYRDAGHVPAASPPAPQLLMAWGPDIRRVGERLVLYGAPVVFGRGDSASAFPGGAINDDMMSRRHAEFVPSDEGTVAVRDLGSSNGTFVNGECIKGSTSLQNGDVVRVGSTLLVFVVEPVPAACPEPVELTGVSACANSQRERIAGLAAASIAVLLQGESGTGKEVAARALHRLSGRKGQFVAVDCPNVSESLWESELFGHEKGAFTGAAVARKGHIREADRGTLFLDEIGELPLSMQSKLLRVLETATVDPVGGRPVAVDVRFVSATNRNLAQAVAEGQFRSDLFARLAHGVVTLPPLRERKCDIPILCRRFLDELGRQGAKILVADLERLMLHSWPLNVRELRSLVQLLVSAAPRGARHIALTPEALERLTLYAEAAGNTSLAGTPGTQPPLCHGPRGQTVFPGPSFGTPLRQGFIGQEATEGKSGILDPGPRVPVTRELLIELLKQHHGNVTDVSAALGRHRWHVYRLLEKHGVDPDEYRD